MAFIPPTEVRLRLPRHGEIFGIVNEMSGGSRMIVDCADGKRRLARIPGKIKRKLVIRAGDIVLIVPWSVEGDEKCDIAYRFTRLQVGQLQAKGFLKDIRFGV